MVPHSVLWHELVNPRQPRKFVLCLDLSRLWISKLHLHSAPFNSNLEYLKHLLCAWYLNWRLKLQVLNQMRIWNRWAAMCKARHLHDPCHKSRPIDQPRESPQPNWKPWKSIVTASKAVKGQLFLQLMSIYTILILSLDVSLSLTMTSLHRPPYLMATQFIAKKELWLVEKAFLWQLNRRYHPLNWLHLIPRQKRMISLWDSIHTAQTKELHLCTFYKPPSAPSTRLDFLAQSVSALYQRNKKSHPHIIIAGDFNFSDIIGNLNPPCLQILPQQVTWIYCWTLSRTMHWLSMSLSQHDLCP